MIPRTKIAAALAEMRRQIAEGGEYPDVEWRVSLQHGIPPAELRAAYDDGDPPLLEETT